MFSLNESNQFLVFSSATDMRKGLNMLCGIIMQHGLDPCNGDVYVFISSSRHILKLLVWESGGYAVYYKRLEAGRISPSVFNHDEGGFKPIGWDELVLFMMGISPKTPRRKRYQKEIGHEGEKRLEKAENNGSKIWLSR